MSESTQQPSINISDLAERFGKIDRHPLPFQPGPDDFLEIPMPPPAAPRPEVRI